MTSTIFPVRLDRTPDRSILLITVDNPPINIITSTVRQGLLEALEVVSEDAELVGAVLSGAAGNFLSGSDLREFDGTIPEPLLPQVIGAIEALRKPVVAAMDGLALGGGLEVALACDYRIATHSSQLGLPETTLGLIPGAGGIQRLSRLCGRVTTLTIVASASRMAAADACEIGIVDELSTSDALLAAAESRARSASKRVVASLSVADDDEDLFERAAINVLGSGNDRVEISEAVRLIRLAGTRPIAEALADERTVFDSLRLSPSATAARHAFLEK